MEKAEQIKFETNPEKFECRKCELAAVIGLLTGTCELMEDSDKVKCWEGVKKLEKEEKSAEDVLADFLLKFAEEGEDRMNALVERINFLLMKAEEKARSKLRADGASSQ